jgi:hypothetical protein
MKQFLYLNIESECRFGFHVCILTFKPIEKGKRKVCMLTCTKNPPASMKVITVTEARVVALFKSINVAPIASPSPCFAASYI